MCSLFNAVILLALLKTPTFPLVAATSYWDINGNTAGAGGTTPSGTWSTSNSQKNWNSDSTGGTNKGSAWTTGDTAVFSAGTDATGSYTVTISGGVSASGLFFEDGTVTVTGSTLTLIGSGIDVATGKTATISSTLAGTVGLTKTSAGTLILSGSSNTYTGATTVSGGTLQLNASNQIGDTSDVSIASGATLQFDWGAFTETVGSLSGSGTLSLRGSTLITNTSADTTFSGTITDSYGVFRKDGTGALTLSGNNTYTGITYIDGGAIVARSNTALGASTYGNTIASGGALHLGGGITVTESNFFVQGTGVGSTGAIVNLDGANTLAAGLNLQGNTLVSNTSGTLAITGTVDAGSSTLTVAGGAGTTLSGVIQGTGGSYIQTGGTVTFSGSTGNTYSGATTVQNGTLQLGKTSGVDAITSNTAVNIGDGVGGAGTATLSLLANEQIANSNGLLTIASDGRLQLNNFTETINLIAGTGLIDLGASGKLSIGVNSGSSTFGGTVTGSGILEKLGSGSLTFNSSLNFTGELRLGAGTVDLNGNSLSVSMLHITGSSVIDFGASTASLLSASTIIIDAGATLTINGWVDMVDYFLAGNLNGATVEVRGSGTSSQIIFSGSSGSSTVWNKYGEITPVPEPSTYGVLFMALATGGYACRRRRRA